MVSPNARSFGKQSPPASQLRAVAANADSAGGEGGGAGARIEDAPLSHLHTPKRKGP